MVDFVDVRHFDGDESWGEMDPLQWKYTVL